MTKDSIIFPGLKIVFKNVGRGFDILGFDIAYYGIVISLGMILATIFISRNCKHYGENPETFYDMTLFGIICGVIGARIYYVIFSWDLYKDDLISIFNLRNGGLAIYGGIIGGALLVFFFTKKKGINFFTAADIVMPGVTIGQILGRWGNFFNREAFGGYSEGIFRMGIPVSAVRSGADVTEAMRSNIETIEGIDFIFVHPTFFYESLWNTIVFVLMVIMGRKGHRPGTVLAMYLGCYGMGRFIIERLRTDQLLIPGTIIPVSMVVSIVCILLAILVIIRNRTLDKATE